MPDLMVALRTAAPERPNSALKSGSLDLEFLNRVDRRQHDKVRAVEEVDGVGVVVDAVEHVVVLRGAIAVGGERAAGCIAASVRLRSVHAGGELRKEGEVSAVQRKIVDVALIDDLADRRVLALQNGSRRRDFDRLGNGSGLEFEIPSNPGADVDDDMGTDRGLETGNVPRACSCQCGPG